MSLMAQNYTNTSTERTAYIRITGGRMSFVVTVNQEKYELPIRFAAPGVIGYIKGTNTLTLKGSKEYASNPDIAQYATDNFDGLSDQTVYVAYFQFGSLIAISSDPTDTSYPSLDRDDILAAPDEWKGSLEGARTAIGTTWSNIPVYTSTDWSTASKRNVSDPSYHVPLTGKGDPCLYYFGEKHGGGWRLPVGGSNNATYEPAITNGGWNAGTFGKTNWESSTNHSGAHSTWFAINNAGSDIPPGIRAGDGTPGYPADWTMFLPATGRRSRGGIVGAQAQTGYYWSSTAHSAINGYNLTFDYTYVYPSVSNTYTWGFSVRCVRP